MLKRIHQATTLGSEDDPESAPALVSRFVQRVLRSVSNESRAISTTATPGPGQGVIYAGDATSEGVGSADTFITDLVSPTARWRVTLTFQGRIPHDLAKYHHGAEYS